jgi:predicted nuclease with TOPRIM domain
MTDETVPNREPQPPQVPVGCIIASTQIIPEIVSIRGHMGETNREMSRHDDRLNRLHLQADDANRRLTRLEGMVETQTKEFQTLSRRFDSLDGKVQSLLDGFGNIKSGIEMLTSAFTAHGISTTELHQKRMRGQMSLWVVLGGLVVILGSMHYQSTGFTPLQSMVDWIIGLMP